jgi:hypothetical protein
VVALRTLSYGVASDAVDEYLRISECWLHRFPALVLGGLSDPVREPNKGKEKMQTNVLEAVAEGEFWIRHAAFGYPGTLKYLNVLDMSSTMERIFHGDFPPDLLLL